MDKTEMYSSDLMSRSSQLDIGEKPLPVRETQTHDEV